MRFGLSTDLRGSEIVAACDEFAQPPYLRRLKTCAYNFAPTAAAAPSAAPSDPPGPLLSRPSTGVYTQR